MKIIPYLNFNGNCAKALTFYEKAFNSKAESCTWGDAIKFDPKAVIPKGKEKWIMHASMKISDGAEIQFADCDEHGSNTGTNICIQLSYKTAEEVKAVYAALKNGGRIICKIGKTFYSEMYADIVDKFGIRWSIMVA